MRVAITLMALFLCCFIAACSSGGGGSTAESVNYVDIVLDDANDHSDAFSRYKNEIPVIPTKGTATYEGSAYIYEMQGRDLFGGSNLTADFSDSSISGRMDGFTARNGEKVDGHINIARGNIVGSDFNANLSGQLADTDLTGKLDGSFYGTNVNVIHGTFKANIGGKSTRGTITAQQ